MDRQFIGKKIKKRDQKQWSTKHHTNKYSNQL